MWAISAAVGRERLVPSPEEEYATSGGLRSDPQLEHSSQLEKQVFDSK